ncbi:hypothetical protein HDV64DRAFT_250918 [Trichoderma sp. TUCIM 5745]
MERTFKSILNILAFTWVHAYDVLKNNDSTAEWRKNKAEELQFVSVTSTLIASTVAASLSWPAIGDAHWTVTAFWMNSLTLAIISTLMAFQQNTILSAKEPPIKYLTKNKVANALALQAPVQFLSYSIATYFVGLFIYIAYPIQNGFHDSLTKIAITYMSFTLLYLLFYIFVSWRLNDIATYEEKDDESQQRLRLG